MTKQVLLILTTLVVILGLIGLVSARRQSNSIRLQKTEAITGIERVNLGKGLMLVQRQNRTAPLETEIVTVTPHGFEPREITRPSGSFVLSIENRSGLRTMVPQLGLAGGLNVLDLNLPREEPDWSDVVNLEPGMYLLREPNHPTWLCRLRLTR